MADQARDAVVDVIARDKTTKPVEKARRAYERLKKQVERTTKTQARQQEKVNSAFTKHIKTLLGYTRAVGKAVSTTAGFVSLLGPMTVGLLAAAKGVAAFTKGLVGLNPLAAFLPSIAGALALIVGTVKLIGPGLGRALTPIVRQFQDADGNATRFTKRLQELAAKGVEPLAKQFVKVNFPRIAAGMERVSRATNRVVVAVGKWVNSAEGQRLIQIITTRTANAVDRLAPKISAAVIALGKLALRAGDKGLQKLADTVGRIIDAFTRWANSTSIEDIRRAISDLSGWFTKLRDAFNVVRDIGRWLQENEGKVRKFASAIAAVGLALGILSANPFAVIVAGLSLLITNWETAKSKLSGALTWWSNLWNSIKQNPAIQELVREVQVHFARMWQAIQPLWQQFREQLLPQLKELKTVIMRDLLPAVSAFIAAASPIVVWLVTQFGPIVIATFKMVIGIVAGALRVLAGIINVITAAIRGDWSKFWNGIRQIVSGNGQIINALVRGWFAILKGIFTVGIAAAAKVAGTLKGRIMSAFKDAGSWLLGVGRKIVEGLANGIRSGAGLIPGAISGLIDKAKSMVPGPLRGALNWSAGDNGWRPAMLAAQFAGAGGNFAVAGAGAGTSRTGGPTPVSVDVSLAGDLAQFFQLTSRTVVADRQRERWRDRVGPR